MADDNFFDEWASGIQIANPSANNEFFEEFQGNLDKPADFHVDPDQVPENPIAHHSDLTPQPNPQPQAQPEDDGPEVLEIDGLGTVSLEKSSKGWKAVVASNDRGIADQNFYGPNLKQLVLNFAKNALNGTIAIRKLKTEKLLGGNEPEHISVPQKPINPSVNSLTADEIIGIKNELADNPDKALSDWMQKKLGVSSLDELAEALKAAPEAKRLVDAQTVKADTAEVIDDFLKNNQDYTTQYNTAENGRLLIRRLAKVHLKKTVSKDLKVNVDDVIYELYKSGSWTEENLEAAKEELIDAGALQLVSTSVPATQPQPQPAASSAPEPPKHIAKNPGQPVGLGLPARGSTSVVIPEEKPLSDINLTELPMDQLRKIAMAQLQAMKQGR